MAWAGEKVVEKVSVQGQRIKIKVGGGFPPKVNPAPAGRGYTREFWEGGALTRCRCRGNVAVVAQPSLAGMQTPWPGIKMGWEGIK